MLLPLALFDAAAGFVAGFAASSGVAAPRCPAARAVSLDGNSERKLHAFSNRAIKRGSNEDARRAYEVRAEPVQPAARRPLFSTTLLPTFWQVAIENFGSGESFLLMAVRRNPSNTHPRCHNAFARDDAASRRRGSCIIGARATSTRRATPSRKASCATGTTRG